jgi:hypothetical protein
MTKAEWARREDLRLQLEELLKQSPLKEALEVCASLDVDQVHGLPVGVDILHWAALDGREREGYHRFSRNLRALAVPFVEPKPEPQPWAHIAPKPLTHK